MDNIIVVDNLKDCNIDIEGLQVISAKSYLHDDHYALLKRARVFNLCKSYKYQTIGYYVSLLAEARGHKVFPHVTTIQDFGSNTIIRVISSDIDALIQKSLSKLKTKEFTLSIYFGKNMAKQYEKLSKQLYNLFQCPLLRAKFVYHKRWILQYIAPVPLKDIPESHKSYLTEFARDYFSKKKFGAPKATSYLYNLAILVNPKEVEPPSDTKAIQKFIEAGKSLGFYIETITKDDFSRIPNFDALFIRETTAVNHHTYRFSRRANKEDMVVIDDPISILKCTNKVYLAELLGTAKVPTPKTLIVHKENREKIERELNLPCVLKKPDSSFSLGVVKTNDIESLHTALDEMFKTSDLIIAQEFIPTQFDWRIGVLDRKPLYACKYFMAKNHWQIYNWNEKRKSGFNGDSQTLPVYQVPKQVIKTALKAANLIGDGFYGVDLKQIDDKIFVIEINDNPSITSGIEDEILQDELYLTIMRSFLNRLQKRYQK